jgi:hypothetical protein
MISVGNLHHYSSAGTHPNVIPHIYNVWKLYSPTFTRYGTHIPSHLLSVETAFPIPILKVCLISQDDISIFSQYVPPGCYFPRGRTGIARRKSSNLKGNIDLLLTVAYGSNSKGCCKKNLPFQVL